MHRIGPAQWHTFHRGCWFRLFGYGVGWKDTRTRPLLWSERNGRWKRVQVGHWSVKLLPEVATP